MSPESFAEAMGVLSEQFPHPPMTPARSTIYARFLADLTDDELQRAVAVSVTEGGEFFPTVATLRERARPLPTTTEVAPLFEAIEAHCTVYCPVTGTTWSPRLVEQRYGAHAREAFTAAGGSPAFERLHQGNNRVFTMKAFAEAYRESRRNGAREALLGPPPDAVKALVAGVAHKLAMPNKKTLGPGGSR